MYLEHYGLNISPFALFPRLDFLFRSGAFEESMAHLVYGLKQNEAIVMITGPIGTGKTMAIQSFMSHLGSKYKTALITNTNVTATELLKLILDDLGVYTPKGSDKSDLLISFKNFLMELGSAGGQVVVVVDEAQNLSPDVLEEVRLLTNLGQGKTQPVTIVLVGQTELIDNVNKPELKQLRQRIRVHYSLVPMTRDELADYIDHRMVIAGGKSGVFNPGAFDRIFELSKGVSRVVNTLADSSLLSAFVGGRDTVEVGDVHLNSLMADPGVDLLEEVPLQDSQAVPRLASKPVIEKNTVIDPAPETAPPVVPELPQRPSLQPPAQPVPAPAPSPIREDGGAHNRHKTSKKGPHLGWLVGLLVLAVLGLMYQTGTFESLSTQIRESDVFPSMNQADSVQLQPDAGGIIDDIPVLSASVEIPVGIEGMAVDRYQDTDGSSEVVAGGYYVHISSFLTPQRADVFQRNLRQKGVKSHVKVLDVNGKDWYRVYIGPFNQERDAFAAAGQFKDEGWITYFEVLEAKDVFLN